MDEHYDLIIVGGGIAGMTAAIYAAKANLNALVLEKEICGGLANFTYSVENFPSYPRINGRELMEKVKTHVESIGVRIEEIVEVTGVQFTHDHKEIVTLEKNFSAKSAILATGRIPIKLPIETEWDEHVHYCSVCDGAGYKGKDLVLVGGGNSGFDESLYLIDLGIKSIVIVESMKTCLAAETTQRKAFETGKIAVKTNTRVSAIFPKSGRGQVLLENIESGLPEEITADGIFVFIGQVPNTKILDGIVDLDSSGYILTDSLMHTNCPGVFAAGDVVAKKYRQLTTAMSDGTIAALEAVKFVREHS